MTSETEPRVVAAKRIGDDAFIEFADGKSALFPASFLAAHRPWYAMELPHDASEQPEG